MDDTLVTQQPAPGVTLDPVVPVEAQLPPKPKRKLPVAALLGLGIALLLLLVVGVVVVTRRGTTSSSTGALVWWGLWLDEDAVQPVIDQFQTDHPGVSVTYVKQSPQDYRERLQSALARGEGPDIFRFHNTWVPMFARQLAVVPSSTITPAEFANTYYPVAVSDLTRDGELVGIPLQYDGLVLFINEDIFSANSVNPPQTWVEFRQLAQQLTRRTQAGDITQAGAALGLAGNVDYWPEVLGLMLLQNGANPAVPSSGAATDALSFFSSFATTLATWSADLPPSTNAFVGGQLAMYFAPASKASDLASMNPNLRFRAVPVPQLPKENSDVADIAYASYWVEGVSSASKSQSLAWEFLQYLSTPEVLTKLHAADAAKRGSGFTYPRRDMAGLLAGDKVAGPLLAQAPDAKSWYLASRTFDGPTGINSQLGNLFGQAVVATSDSNGQVGNSLVNIEADVQNLLVHYGLFKR